MKMGKKRWPMIFSIFAALLITLVAFFYLNPSSNLDEAEGSREEYNDNSGLDNPSLDEESSGVLTNIVGAISSAVGIGGSSGGGGGSSGDSSGDAGSASPSCSNLQYSYALKDFNETIQCTSYVDGLCTSLFANCSMAVANLDVGSPAAEFEIRYDLRDRVTDEVLSSKTFLETLEYHGEVSLIAEFNLVDSNGINENLECAFKSVSIPRKEVCE